MRSTRELKWLRQNLLSFAGVSVWEARASEKGGAAWERRSPADASHNAHTRAAGEAPGWTRAPGSNSSAQAPVMPALRPAGPASPRTPRGCSRQEPRLETLKIAIPYCLKLPFCSPGYCLLDAKYEQPPHTHTHTRTYTRMHACVSDRFSPFLFQSAVLTFM